MFPKWTATPSTFEEDVRLELKGGADAYLYLYSKYIQRMAGGDFMAMFDSTVDSQIVQHLMFYGDELSPSLRMQRIKAFFDSEDFANVPRERISAEFFALLRAMLRAGSYVSREKALKRFKGFFYDVRFISTYAPYCDAMVVDAVMHRWATHSLVDLTSRFGTRFFSRSNWQDLLAYLEDVRRTRSADLTTAASVLSPKCVYKICRGLRGFRRRSWST